MKHTYTAEIDSTDDIYMIKSYLDECVKYVAVEGFSSKIEEANENDRA